MKHVTAYVIDRVKLRHLLMQLQPGDLPLWGKMKPQQMVAHLVDEVKWSNGKRRCTCIVSAEQAERNKNAMIHSDIALPKNFYAGDLPDHYLTITLENAVEQLMEELNQFDRHFQNDLQKEMHPRFGPLNEWEWFIWQDKHFTHHLKQFSLIPENAGWVDSEDLKDCFEAETTEFKLARYEQFKRMAKQSSPLD